MMSETIPSSSEWFPFHEQTSIHGQAEPYSSSLGFSDATIVTTTTTTPIGASDHSLVLSPTCSTTATAPLTPKYQMQQQEQQPLQQQHHDHQQSLHQEQKYMVSSLEDFYFRGPRDIGTTTAGNNLEIPDEILIMDDFPLYELARESLYNENMNVTSS
ncbi:hypothetical protein GH714_037342 [Hevea brasiliensis]|uniref:Uncharacterized protein n=1 Tax=Hevea brasiliensis TaxID=3981 RepID=A0A6A6KX35_HEVBR|nr:hypothetical protein GH714_037342 [Hevea brasiliensis]